MLIFHERTLKDGSRAVFVQGDWPDDIQVSHAFIANSDPRTLQLIGGSLFFTVHNGHAIYDLEPAAPGGFSRRAVRRQAHKYVETVRGVHAV